MELPQPKGEFNKLGRPLLLFEQNFVDGWVGSTLSKKKFPTLFVKSLTFFQFSFYLIDVWSWLTFIKPVSSTLFIWSSLNPISRLTNWKST